MVPIEKAMILLPDNISQATHGIGEKARNLKRLKDMSLRVPAFVVLPAPTISALYRDETRKILKNVVHEILGVLPADRYIVRSSALIEDTKESSFAGQFLSEGHLKQSEISEAIIKIIQHAAPLIIPHLHTMHSTPALTFEKKPNQIRRCGIQHDLNQFSLIIQEFIEATYAGVAFTRNPLIGREMVIEYHKGLGEAVVQGIVSPKRLQCYWNNHTPQIKELPRLSEMIGAFKKIEQRFSHPQDIEWCLKGKDYYFLQTRPVTTISEDDYKGLLYLDRKLPSQTPFFFEKMPLTEIAERPTPFTFSLLKRLYRKNGPIHAVYKRYRISYEPTNFLVRIGNELYSDREKELHTLFPSMSYLYPSLSDKPRIARPNGIIATLQNIHKFQKMSLTRSGVVAEQLKATLEKPYPDFSFEKALTAFLQDYELIFEANLMAEKAVQEVMKFVSHASIPIARLLAYLQSVHDEGVPIFDATHMVGNSLEIADSTPFQNRLLKNADDATVAEWLKSVKDKEKTALEHAGSCVRLREYGRWLTVKHINTIREHLMHLAEEKHFEDPSIIYFATIRELLTDTYDEKLCKKRRHLYLLYSRYHFPPRLTSDCRVIPKDDPLGVSPGIAQGTLVNIHEHTKKGDTVILYTQTLSPNLTQYFDSIKGIISEHGGLLSHLAIMAREWRMPVIVQANLVALDLKMGDTVQIDGETGIIKKL